MVIKLIYPDALDIVGIAVDPTPGETSEDALYLDARMWTLEQEALAQTYQEDHSIFRNPRRLCLTDCEYPISDDPPESA